MATCAIHNTRRNPAFSQRNSPHNVLVSYLPHLPSQYLFRCQKSTTKVAQMGRKYNSLHLMESLFCIIPADITLEEYSHFTVTQCPSGSDCPSFCCFEIFLQSHICASDYHHTARGRYRSRADPANTLLTGRFRSFPHRF